MTSRKVLKNSNLIVLMAKSLLFNVEEITLKESLSQIQRNLIELLFYYHITL